MAIQTPCISCNTLYTYQKGRSRCDECQAEKDAARDKRRGSAYTRGYSAEYKANAAKVKAYALKNGLNCELCGLPFGEEAMTVDHIVSLARGGDSSLENLRVAHQRCNSAFGAKGYRSRKDLDIGKA